MPDTKSKIFVAMSGGVDSSVAAALLKESGHDVVGVTMCFSLPPTRGRRPSCCGAEGIQDAKRAAQILDIPHHVFDFAKDIDKYIIDNFMEEYLNGRTPNPCVRCNQYLKFGLLLDKVKALGADYLATGHYARIIYNQQGKRYELKEGIDSAKDQSYFLYSIRKEALPFILFPLGNLTKSEVRGLAKKYSLKNAEKQASQDICFVPDMDYKRFIDDRLGQGAVISGPIKNETGNIVGEHKGIARYTVGQRDGLGIALGKPVYVTRIDKESNTVFIGDQNQLLAESLTASTNNFVSIDVPKSKISAKIKIRYSHPGVEGSVMCLEDDSVFVEFDKPQRAVTPGQSVVFYEGDVILGGGIIEGKA